MRRLPPDLPPHVVPVPGAMCHTYPESKAGRDGASVLASVPGPVRNPSSVAPANFAGHVECVQITATDHISRKDRAAVDSS